MNPATHILTAVVAELPSTEEVFTARELEVRVVKTAYRLYRHVARYAPHRQAKAAFSLAPAIAPASSYRSYREALRRAVA